MVFGMFTDQSIIFIMDLGNWESITAIGASCLAVGGALWATILRPMFRLFKKSMSELACIPQLVTDVSDIKMEVRPNGGMSLRDSVERIELRQLLDSQIIGSILSSQAVAFFRADERGLLVEASRPLCKLMQRSEAELIGNKWLSWVTQDQREEVHTEWVDAVENARDFDKRFDVFNDSGDIMHIHAKAYQLVNRRKRETLGYFGTFSRVKEEA